MPDRKKPPKTELITSIPFINPTGARLPNGLPIYFMEGGTEDFLKVEMVFFAGSYQQFQPLVAYATANLIRSGSRHKNREEIHELLDFYSAHLQLDAQKDITSVSMFVLNKHLEPALDLMAELIRDPLFPEEELLAFLKNQKQLHLINQKKVQHLARTCFNELVYGESHPYGYKLKVEDFDQVNRDQLLAFHHHWYRPENAFCIVSGKLPDHITQAMAHRFGDDSWLGQDKPVSPFYKMLSTGSRKVHLEVPGAVQSAVRIGKQLVNRTHPSFHKLKITNALFGGYFGSRLMQNIRQDKGFTYGIGSNLVSLLKSGYFFISTQVGTVVTHEAIKEIYKELVALRTVPASDDELETLKNYLSGSFLRSFDGPFAQSERLKELLVFGLDQRHYDDYLTTLKTIKAEEIMLTAADYLHEDSMMEVVAGGPG